MDNHTRELLGLTDLNINFSEDWLEKIKIKGVTAYQIKGTLTYTPTACEKCGLKNQGGNCQEWDNYHQNANAFV